MTSGGYWYYFCAKARLPKYSSSFLCPRHYPPAPFPAFVSFHRQCSPLPSYTRNASPTSHSHSLPLPAPRAERPLLYHMIHINWLNHLGWCISYIVFVVCSLLWLGNVWEFASWEGDQRLKIRSRRAGFFDFFLTVPRWALKAKFISLTGQWFFFGEERASPRMTLLSSCMALHDHLQACEYFNFLVIMII